MLFSLSGADFHCLWFFVNKAKAFAPIADAFKGAFSYFLMACSFSHFHLIFIHYSIIRLMMLYALTMPNSPALLKSAMPWFVLPWDKWANPRLK